MFLPIEKFNMRYFRRLVLSILTLTTLFINVNAQTIKDVPFQDGENTTLVVHYKWGVINADIAEVSIQLTEEVYNNENCIHVLANASTYPFWDKFFKVRDIYEAIFTADNVKPRYFHRDVNEGNYSAQNFYHWKPNSNDVDIKVTKSTRPPLDSTLNVGRELYDLITMVYHARSVDFEELEKKPINFVCAIDKNLMDVQLRFMGREEKNIKDLGKFNTVKVGASVTARKGNEKSDVESNFSVTKEGVFKGKDDVIIWFSDDSNKVPLTFRSPVAVGSINGRMVKVDGTKYPLTSQLLDE